MQGEEVTTIWTVDISTFNSEHDLSDLVFINDDFIALAKGKKIILYSSTGEIVNEIGLDLISEIRSVKLIKNGSSMIIRTDSEIVQMPIEEMKKGITRYKSNGGDSDDFIDLNKKKSASWIRRLWS